VSTTFSPSWQDRWAIDEAWEAVEDLTEIGHHEHHHGWWHHHEHHDHDDHDDHDQEDFQVTAGDDTLYGGAGDDVMFGQDGRDRLYGGDGDDYLVGGGDSDTLEGATGKKSKDRDTIRSGHDTSSTLANILKARLVIWAGHLDVYGTSQALGSPSPWAPYYDLDLDDEAHDQAFVIRPDPKPAPKPGCWW